MEWSERNSRFEKKTPSSPPTLEVKVTLMEDVHREFGVNCDRKQPIVTTAVTDTGCQTSTAGTDFMQTMGMSERHLIPTCHKIVGITDTRLVILGVAMLEIEANGLSTKQMVYISSNSSGLYFCLLYTSPSPRDRTRSRMPSSA